MSPLPDRFDLWVRQARQTSDPARQADLILGGLIAQPELYFFNAGRHGAPMIAQSETGADRSALIFSSPDRVETLAKNFPALLPSDKAGAPLVIMPGETALTWCEAQGAGLLVNSEGYDAVEIPHDVLAAFLAAWKADDTRRGSGFWVPNLTTEEEDFWQHHGL